jgi:DNA repair exonuclease SbcCD ATPase subunit
MSHIKYIELENFRGFAQRKIIDLDADLILITGKNGVGKTSILLALDLLLNGTTGMLGQVGSLVTAGESSGWIRAGSGNPVVESELDLGTRKAPRLHAELLERAQFFFPEALGSPDNSSDILSILSPTSSDWDSIKDALASAQDVLTRAKPQILIQEFDVNLERRRASQGFEEARAAIKAEGDEDAKLVSLVQDPQNILIKGNNLAKHWEGQLRNLVRSLNEEANTLTSSSEGSPAEVLLELADLFEDIAQQKKHVTVGPDARIHQFEMLAKSLAGVSPSNRLILNPAAREAPDGRSNITDVQRKREAVTQQLRETREHARRVYAGNPALLPLLTDFAENADGWMDAIHSIESDGVDVTILTKWLQYTGEALPELTQVAEAAQTRLRHREGVFLAEIARLETALHALRENEAIYALLEPFENEQWLPERCTVEELRALIATQIEKSNSSASSTDTASQTFSVLARATRQWAATEREIERRVALAGDQEKRAQAEKLLSDAEKTLKRAQAKDGVFSLISQIDDDQLVRLLRSLNKLLARFHFPPEFLPFQLQPVSARAKTVTYRFVSKQGHDYAGLSTGQKTQLAVCWSVVLNYALASRLTAPLIAFDDFTTALDMGQLIPAAGMLRQLAYTQSDRHRRQVIVTSHHEDLTNRLVDYLIPPQGRSMKVIEMVEWSVGQGPEMVSYDVRPSEPAFDKVALANWLNSPLTT